MTPTSPDSAEHILYRTYWSLVLEDALFHLGFTSIMKDPDAKELLHDFHKRILDCDTTSDMNHQEMSEFIQKVCLFWAVEMGIFVRTSRKQPLYIEDMDLFDIVKVDGEEKRVWDIL